MHVPDGSFRDGGSPAEGENLRWAETQIREALRGLRYGEVTVIVQDGVVVQVERTDRIRPPRGARSSNG